VLRNRNFTGNGTGHIVAIFSFGNGHTASPVFKVRLDEIRGKRDQNMLASLRFLFKFPNLTSRLRDPLPCISKSFGARQRLPFSFTPTTFSSLSAS
jgi:hypothetical protein